MAQLIRAEGTLEEIRPAHGTHFTLAELQTLVGGYIEIVQTMTSGKLMVIDEEGKLKNKPTNALATVLYKYRAHDYIVGDVIVGTHLELNGPNTDDEGDVAVSA